jgi:WD40 repeat protein
MRNWKPIGKFLAPAGISSLCFFGKGYKLAMGETTSGRVLIADLSEGGVSKEIVAYQESEFGSFSISAIAANADGKLLLVGAGLVVLKGMPRATRTAWEKSIDPIRLIDAGDGAVVATLPEAKAPILQAKWDPLGRFVAFIDSDKGLFIWAPWSHKGYLRVELPSPTFAFAISPDGRRLALTTTKCLRVFSINDIT